MKKIVITLIIAFSFGVTMAQEPTQIPESKTGQVNVDVIKMLSIEKHCPCDYQLPPIVVGTEILRTVTSDKLKKVANFRVIGQPGYQILITVNGVQPTGSPSTTREYTVNGVTLTGTWGKFEDGKKHSPWSYNFSGFTAGLPTYLSGAYDPNISTSWVLGTIYCSFVTDKLQADGNAPLGERIFTLEVCAEYAI